MSGSGDRPASRTGLGRLEGHAMGAGASVLAVGAAYGLHRLGGFPLLLAVTLAGLAAAFWAAPGAARPRAETGLSLVGQVLGQWIALWPLSLGLWWMGMPAHVFPWPGWVGGFVVFRALVTARPWLLGRLARRGPKPRLSSDIAAGAATAVAVALAAALAHGAFA